MTEADTATLPRPTLVVADAPQLRIERLYRTCRDDLYAYLATVLGDRGLAEEVTALAFERAFRRQRLFNPRRGSERAWLFGIARNAALDELRRGKRSAPLLAEPAELEGTCEGHLDSIVRRETVRAALTTLTPRERELVALKFHGGLSNVEIGRVLRVSESNAGTLLHRATTKLRRACDEQA